MFLSSCGSRTITALPSAVHPRRRLPGPAFAVAERDALMPSHACHRGPIMTVLIAGGGIGGVTPALRPPPNGVAAQKFESGAPLRAPRVRLNVLPPPGG